MFLAKIQKGEIWVIVALACICKIFNAETSTFLLGLFPVFRKIKSFFITISVSSFVFMVLHITEKVPNGYWRVFFSAY